MNVEEQRDFWRKKAKLYRHTLTGAAEYFDDLADNTEHDCGNFDGGNTQDCEACQYKRTAEHYWRVICGEEE